jgi:hypothetical protein
MRVIERTTVISSKEKPPADRTVRLVADNFVFEFPLSFTFAHPAALRMCLFAAKETVLVQAY